MTKIYTGVVIFFPGLAYYMFIPEIVCSTIFLDSSLRPIEGPFSNYKGGFLRRRIGILIYTNIDGRVYRVTEMVGGSLPSRILRRRIPKTNVLIRFDGPVEWEKLQSYFHGEYLSDGNRIFTVDGRSVLSLVPALDIKNLKIVPSATPGSHGRLDYATDGRWVIRGNKVVEGADAATFRQIYALERDGSVVESQRGMIFGIDARRVYYEDSQLDNAEPEIFNLISYALCHDPPEDIYPRYYQVGVNGWIAFDRARAWEANFTGITALPVTQAHLKAFQKDWQHARANSKGNARDETGIRVCTR